MGRRKLNAPIDLPYIISLTGCHIYTGDTTDEGYGRINIQGVRWLVHRLIWTVNNGVIAPGIKICHTCDTPPCFLLEHLFDGTQKENIQDASVKKRLGRATKALGNWKGGRPKGTKT